MKAVTINSSEIMFHLPTDVLVHEITPLLSNQDLRCLDVAVSDGRMRRLLMDVYPALRSLQHSTRGLNEHEMTWFFKRGIPLSSISFAKCNTSDNITRIFHMIHDSGYAKAVKRISLRLCHKVLAATHFAQMLTICTSLEALNLTKCGNVAADFISQLGQRCAALTSLDFEGNYEHSVSISSFRELGRGCPLLAHINLSMWIDNFPEGGIEALTEGGSQLTSICLAETSLGNEAIVVLAENCHSLTSLDITDCGVTHAAVMALSQHCPLLATLKMFEEEESLSDVSDESVIVLAHGCPLLRRLDIYFAEISDTSVVVLAQLCKTLQHLDVAYCADVSDAAVMALVQYCPRLTYLGVRGTKVTDVSVLAVANGGLGNLVRIDVCMCDLITDNARQALSRNRSQVVQDEDDHH